MQRGLGSAVGCGAALVTSGAAAGSVCSRGTQRRHERLAGGTEGQANQPHTACKRARDGLALEAHFYSGSFRVSFAVLV